MSGLFTWGVQCAGKQRPARQRIRRGVQWARSAEVNGGEVAVHWKADSLVEVRLSRSLKNTVVPGDGAAVEADLGAVGHRDGAGVATTAYQGDVAGACAYGGGEGEVGIAAQAHCGTGAGVRIHPQLRKAISF